MKDTPAVSFGVLYEDENLLALDKPSGLLTIPGRTTEAPSLWRLAEAQRGGRLWPVHRLDRETSGIVLFAKTAEKHRMLNGAFERREVHKRYLARVSPSPTSPEGTLVDAIVPARRGFMRIARSGEKGLSAETRYRILDVLGSEALLQLEPVTGRTHQLRLQLAVLGAPIVGEPHYRTLREGAPPPRTAERLWLHAAAIELPASGGGAPLHLESPVPAGLWAHSL